MPATPHCLVFVYGTLKRGGSNHAQLEGARFIGDARLRPGYTMYSLGAYPGLVAEPASADRVTGEIWAVSHAMLTRLDAFEGVDEGLYQRAAAPLSEFPSDLSPTDAARVEMYLYLRPVTGRERLGESWPVRR
ncbi:MAG: gamma-glutamylcyclotransferase [Opitutaceae bacterium]|nr:gamma-glutamylcyclotransferase [Opitutaceae bacterium]